MDGMEINDRICVKACLDHYYMIQRFDLRRAFGDMLKARTDHMSNTADYYRRLCRTCARNLRDARRARRAIYG